MKKRLFGIVFLALVSALNVLPVSAQQSDRIALVIGNASYPDAEAPLKQPVQDAKALAEELRRNGYEVDVAENLTKEALQRAIDRLYGKIKSGASVVLFFSGYGIQTGRQTYLIPVNAQIWTEGEVRRDGVGIDSILAELNARGASVKIAILDASRRNPFERRFRGLSLGLAPVTAPRGTLVISAAAPGTVVNDSDGDNSLFVRELLKEMRSPNLTVEEIFNRTRIGVSRASKGEQVPWISSSMVEEYYLGKSSSRPPVVAEPLKPEPTKPEPTKDLDADVRRDYEFADRLGTRRGWEDFLAKYKTGSYADLARDKLAKLDPSSQQSSRLRLPDSKTESKPEPKPESRPEPKPQTTAKVDPKPEPSSKPVKTSLIRELDDIIERNPSDGDSYFKRGLAYAQKNEFAEAIKDFDQVIRLNPKDAEAFNNRCWARAMLGDLQVALRDCNESLRIKPNFIDALDSRGLVNLKIGLPNSAIADYNAALRVNPKHPSALFGRGKAKLKSGDTAGGNADIAAAKAINRDIAEEFESYGIK
jgi:tetratricopeptide (TPR) repeat protein